MNYVLADKDKVEKAGFSMAIHTFAKDGRVIMTEKEVRVSPLLQGTLEDRLKAIDGEVIGGAKFNK